jgi:hypothetical protein
MSAEAHRLPRSRSAVRPRRLPVQLHVHGMTSRNRRSEPERTGAHQRPGSSPVREDARAMTNVTQTLRRWRESKGLDVPRIARELRKAARDTGEDMAAHTVW